MKKEEKKSTKKQSDVFISGRNTVLQYILDVLAMAFVLDLVARIAEPVARNLFK